MGIETTQIKQLLNKANMDCWFAKTGQPFVTLSWAQTLDGSLTLNQGSSSPISCDTSMALTHQIRQVHDGILIGIGTALADNPRLTVRLKHANSHLKHPRPIVLDSQLRIPKELRLFQHPHKPIIAVACKPNSKISTRLNGSAEILGFPATAENQVPLEPLLLKLGQKGISSIMVEGGGQVLTSFLKSGCVNKIIITIAPVFAGGYKAIHPLQEDNWAKLPRLKNMQTFQCGSDLIVAGDMA